MKSQPIIEVKDLVKKYRDASEFSVKNVSFGVERGEVFGLLGPNGAGKTTTISMLCGLIQPTSGTIRIDNLDWHHHPEQIRQLVGVVPQDIALYPTLSARENLDFYGHMYGLKGADLKNKISMWLDHLGLGHAADKQVGTFSGGMKRRVNLIAGILHQPQVLFLDEPTVGVDVQSRAEIIRHLKQLNREGMTIIYTSHHMEEAEHFCTRVSIIDNGEIIITGIPAELVAQFPSTTNLESVFLHLTHSNLRD